MTADGGGLEGLRLRIDELTLRSPLDEDLAALDAVWSDDFDFSRPADAHHPSEPSPLRERMPARLREHRRSTADRWFLELLVETGPGRLVGWATLQAEDFAQQRMVESTSWVAPAWRNRRVATRARTAVLELAFGHLGAHVAISRVLPDNEYSRAASSRLGFRNHGTREPAAPGDPAFELWTLPRQDWRSSSAVDVSGAASCRAWFGV